MLLAEEKELIVIDGPEPVVVEDIVLNEKILQEDKC
jgi:hypothetical protein